MKQLISKFTPIFSVILISIGIATLNYNVQCKPAASHARKSYKLEWVDKPEVTHGFGKTKLITACINTDDKPDLVTVTTNFSHTFELEEGFEQNLDDLLDSVAKSNNVSVTKRRGVRSMLRHKIIMEQRTKGVVLFRDNVIRVSGKVRKTFECAKGGGSRPNGDTAPDCGKSKPEEFFLSLRATEIDPNTSLAIGTFSVDYFGTITYKHPDFYNLAGKALDLSESDQIDDGVKSPYACAEHAISSNRTIALYDVHKMRCNIADAQLNNGTTLDRDGKFVGNFRLPGLDELETNDTKQADKWKLERSCDAIHKLKSNATGDNKDADTFLCVKYEDRPMFVLMFKRMSS